MEFIYIWVKLILLLYLINLIDIIKKILEDWLFIYKYYMCLKEYNRDRLCIFIDMKNGNFGLGSLFY